MALQDSPPSHSLGPLAALARLAAERPTVSPPRFTMRRKFRITLRGHDPSAGFVGEDPRVGFWVVRYVEAETEAEAAEVALQLVLSEAARHDVVREEWTGDPAVAAREIEEISVFQKPDPTDTAYIFFEESEGPTEYFIRDD
jgi:hypothetical protein